jgi:hypothetical protein
MGSRLELVLCGACGLAIAFIACEEPIQRPKTTPTSAITPAGGVVTQSAANGTTGASTTSSSSSSSGTGGAGPTAAVLHTLTCADHETHVVDCESCRAAETQGVCTAEWQTCLGDPYCPQGFFDCVQACTAGDQTCLDKCYVKEPTSETAITNWVDCVCTDCTTFCGG